MFRIRNVLAALLLTLVGLEVIQAESPQSDSRESGSSTQHSMGAQFAVRMEGLLARLKSTSYQHTTEIDEGKGVVNCDCSGIVGFVLRQEFPEAYLSLQGKEASWRKRPLSVTFYETFVAACEDGTGTWKSVDKLMDVLPGDILAWRKKNLDADSTTGHTLMIAGKPELVGVGRVRIRVIDSTRSLHDDDTRPAGTNGMGAGYMTFLVDDSGKCSGNLVDERPVIAMIAVGRLVQATAATSHPEDLEFVGLTKANAIALATKNRRTSRVIREDGKPEPLKLSSQNGRLNFVVANGKVVGVFRG
ncbi:hypothetical protein [Novipirellula artificiosorum]|uniref:Uncharacterized protein n=1 Tax=Novipirellula artificiosorum TaxID=2528016 RepID=A0A5C6D3K1_9BACT|nr:hypothetical protein [Novipirellula artificiosorum]TWU30695.1 hypothetical protein Poly41_66000 [Novipirellula artificiosorum]